MTEAKKEAPKKAKAESKDHAEGPTGSDAREKGYFGRDTHIPNDRYVLTSDDKPHPNEEMETARAANSENAGG